MDKRVWLSRRALKLHAVILVVVPAFMALCVWQITRALGGQQPQLGLRLRVAHLRGLRRLHVVALRARGGRGHAVAARRPDGQGAPAETEAGAQLRSAHGSDEQGQDADLAAYNAYLAQLAERDKATGR